MLLTRQLFDGSMQQAVDGNIFLFCDGSPQWRGWELYASTLDLVKGDVLYRIMLPSIFLRRGQLSALWKTVGLLWQVCLIVGPLHLQRSLSRVRAILTDGGVERLVLDQKLCLEDFFWYMGVKSPRGLRLNEPLFPRAIEILGWRHQWDLVARKGLTELRWFPLFLERLKAPTKFIRDRNLFAELVKRLKTQRLAGAVAILEEFNNVPNFAEWRWPTLYLVTKLLDNVIGTLVEHFDIAWFGTMRDKTWLRQTADALTLATFRSQLEFTLWYCRWLCHIQDWVGGCSCHENGTKEAEECMRKGRRVCEAYAYASEALRDGLEECQAWDEDDFGDLAVDELQAAARAAFVFGGEIIECYDHLPLLAARLDEPGVRDRCIAEYDAAERRLHDPASHALFDNVGASFRNDVLEVTDDGVVHSEALRAEAQSIKDIPMGDTVNESPHARAERVHKHARRSQIPWLAPTFRLQQNLEHLDSLGPSSKVPLQQTLEWVHAGVARDLPDDKEGICATPLPSRTRVTRRRSPSWQRRRRGP